jgi:hypothetical protein
LVKIGREVLGSPGIRQCKLGMRVYVTPVSHRDKKDKKSMNNIWDRVPRVNRGMAGR